MEVFSSSPAPVSFLQAGSAQAPEPAQEREEDIGLEAGGGGGDGPPFLAAPCS